MYTIRRRACGNSFLAGCLALLLSPTAVFGAAISHIGTNQRTLIICVKYSDAATTRVANCSDWVTTLTNEINTFYNQATFNQTNFQFETIVGGGAPADGWLSLGYPSTDYDFFKVGQDAINLADPFANFNLYNRVAVITNWPGFGGQGGGPWWWRVNEGSEATFIEEGVMVAKRLMTLSIVNEWLASSFGNTFDEAGSVLAHELGHHLGVPTHYADVHFFPGITRDVITPWDIMGLSPTLNHFLGWPKSERSWIPAGPRIQTIGPPVGSNIDMTVTLRPLEQSTTGVQLIKIPFTSGSPFAGYMVENRHQINGDENLPAQGVVLTVIDENPGTILHTIVLDDPSAPGNLNAAPLDVGQSFSDPSRNLTVTVLSQSGNNYNVRVQYGLPPSSKPDPAITPWGAPPWETADIWVDSEKNGWGTYRYTDASGNPTGNGDDAWVGHNNRIYAQIRNLGPGVATNVRVEVYRNDPPGMGDAGPNWVYLGTIIFPTVPAGGAPVSDFVVWKPSVGAHTCIKAVILNTPGELSTTNNLAQENVTAFDTSSSSPYGPVTLKASVFNPFSDRKLPVRFHVRDVPLGWGVLLEPREVILAPDGQDSVRLMVFPSGLGRESSQKPYDDKYRSGFIGKPKLEAQIPYADTYIPIGGIDVWTHLVEKTRLTCRLAGAAGEYTPSTQQPPQQKPASPADEQSRAMPGVVVEKGRVSPATKIAPIDPQKLFAQGALVKPPVRLPVVAPKEAVIVSGQLTPAAAGAVIAVEFHSERESKVELVKTTSNGTYRTIYNPKAPGRWTTQAFYSGDMKLGAAESPFCGFMVKGERDK